MTTLNEVPLTKNGTPCALCLRAHKRNYPYCSKHFYLATDKGEDMTNKTTTDKGESVTINKSDLEYFKRLILDLAPKNADGGVDLNTIDGKRVDTALMTLNKLGGC